MKPKIIIGKLFLYLSIKTILISFKRLKTKCKYSTIISDNLIFNLKHSTLLKYKFKSRIFFATYNLLFYSFYNFNQNKKPINPPIKVF